MEIRKINSILLPHDDFCLSVNYQISRKSWIRCCELIFKLDNVYRQIACAVIETFKPQGYNNIHEIHFVKKVSSLQHVEFVKRLK